MAKHEQADLFGAQAIDPDVGWFRVCFIHDNRYIAISNSRRFASRDAGREYIEEVQPRYSQVLVVARAELAGTDRPAEEGLGWEL